MKIDTSKLKNWLTIISLLLVITTGVRSVIVEGKLQLKNDNLSDEILVKTTQVVKYKNKLGQEVTKTIEYKKTVTQLVNSNDSLEHQLGVTIQASNMKEKQLKSALVANYNAQGSGGYSVLIPKTIDMGEGGSDVTKNSLNPNENLYNHLFPLYYTDGYLKAMIYQDSLSYTYHDDFTVLSGYRMIDRNFILWKTIGWKKMIDRDMVEVTTTNPKASTYIQKVRLIDPPRAKIKIGLGATLLVTEDVPKIYGVAKIGYKNFDYLGYLGSKSYGIGVIYNF